MHKKPLSRDFVKILILRTIGNFLVLFSLFIIGKTFYKPVSKEIRYVVEKTLHKQYIVREKGKAPQKIPPSAPQSILASILNVAPVEELIPADSEFSIVIPKIAANARIIPNVDASRKDVYLPALEQGVAHTYGTAFPGEGGHMFLFAHSTDYFWNVSSYNAVFYLLSKLEPGDEINIFYKNQRFVYRNIGRRIVEPSQVEYVTRKTTKEFLTLQTCWPAGTTFKRLLVFATRVVE